jgi:hypothetical protein
VSRVNGKRRNTSRPRHDWVCLENADAPQLISPEPFAAVQQITNRNRQLASRNTGNPEEFLLRGACVVEPVEGRW